VFNTLLRLGAHHNATVYIDGINGGPKVWLDPGHSRQINSSWDHYFDTQAHGGEPFLEVDRSQNKNCLDIYKAKRMLWTDSQTDHQCVNIHNNLFEFFVKAGKSYGHATQFEAPYVDDEFFYPNKSPAQNDQLKSVPAIKVSRAVDEAARRMHHNKPYGFLHIRLCDVESMNSICSEPERVAAFVSQRPEVNTWIVFWYTSPTYIETLKVKLGEVAPRASLVFEDESFFDDVDKNDNYFKSLVMSKVRAGTTTLYDTHMCRGATPFSPMVGHFEPGRHVSHEDIEDMYVMKSGVTVDSRDQGECR